MRYNSDQLKSMAEQIDLADYISNTEELHRAGGDYKIECPFHNGDNTPSLHIYTESNRWHCFGCHAGGDIYEWIQLYDKVSFQAAVEKVANLTGNVLSDCIESESVNFYKMFNKCLKHGDDTVVRQKLDYQKDYVEKYTQDFPQEWINEGMTPEALKAYDIRIDESANRIVYPVLDADGNFISVKGRTRNPYYKDIKIPKYINYNGIGTIDFFQGWQQAIEEIKNRKSVIIFEGVKSCIKAYGWGIKNTIASETANISDGQLNLLIKTGIGEVIIGWDNDQSLRTITSNTNIQMLRRFTKVSVINDKYHILGLPEDKLAPVDKGEEIFRQLLEGRTRI